MTGNTVNINRDLAREGSHRIACVMRELRRLSFDKTLDRVLTDPIADLASGLKTLRDAGVPVPLLNITPNQDDDGA